MSFDDLSHPLHAAASGALASLSVRMPGYPYASALPFVLDEQHCPVFLISRLAEHTANLVANSHASLLVSETHGDDVLQTARLTLVGDARQFEPSEALVARYLRYQPAARQYLALGDFAFFRLSPQCARFVAGFGKMGWVEQQEWVGAAILPLADEAAILQELSSPDIQSPSGVRLLGLDRYGFDLLRDGARERRQFGGAPVEVAEVRGAVQRLFGAG
jgi:hypothetical protein